MDVAGPILLCTGDPAAAEDVARQLESIGPIVRRQFLSDEAAHDEPPALVVLDSRRCEGEVLHFCRKFRAGPANGSVPMLFILGDNSAADRLAALDAGADAYLVRPFAGRELLTRVRSLLRTHERERRLAEKAAEAQQTCQRLRQAYNQIDQDLAAVRQIQRRFLPAALPHVPGADLAVYHHSCGQVGGDSYNGFRLDERHVGFYVADALGHGTPAGLLTMFLQRAVRGKEVNGQGYRLVPPDEVLCRLNKELIEQALPEMPFVTMLYALYDGRDRVLRFARAGHPHPLYIPHDRPAEFWPSPGNLLGVFSTRFDVQTRTLQPGDKVLLYTDGLVQADPDPLLESATRHRDLPIRQCVEALAHELRASASPTDDFTLLGLGAVE